MTAPFTLNITGALGQPIALEAHEIPGHPGILATVLDGRWNVTHRKSGQALGRFSRDPKADYVTCVAQAFDIDPGLVGEVDAMIPDDHEPGEALEPEAGEALERLGLWSRFSAISEAYRRAVKAAKLEALKSRGEHLVEVEIARRATVLVSVVADTPEAAAAIARDLPGYRFADWLFDDHPEVEYARAVDRRELPAMRFRRDGQPSSEESAQ